MHARSGAMRCFAYTHPEMPNELLNILYVAERADVSKSRADVYTPADKSLANVAMLCAGNVTCKGLLGFDLPYRLINELKTDKSIIPASWDVVSLSPMPTFRKWLDALIADNTNASKIEKYLTGEDIRYLRIQGKNSNICEAMCTLLADWVGTLENPTLGKEMPLALEMPLKRLGLAYLRGTREEKGKIRSLDSVYGIHVAKCKEEVVGLHPMADPTTNGIQQSYGMLVNYQSRGNREDIDKLLKIGRTLQ